MNDHWNKQMSEDERRQFDLLADGELDEARRRELLASLDERPDGWRSCALAFLEAQGWRRGLQEAARSGSLSGEHADPSVRPAGPVKMNLQWPSRERMNLVLAMAASFLTAFGLSLLWRGGWSGSDGARTGKSAVEVAGTQPGEKGMNGRKGATQLHTNGLDDRVGSVTLAADGLSGGNRVQVPFVSVDRFDPGLLSGQPDAVPEELIRELKRTGHRVRQTRQLVPIDLQDGRRLVLPVDQMDVHFVGDRYQ